MAEKKIDVVLMDDAVELIKEEKLLSYNEGFADGYKQAISEVNNMARVVYCKDCANGIKVKNGAGEDAIMCDIELEPHCYPLDWFCADGELRTEV